MNVFFLPDNIRQIVEKGDNLMRVAAKAEVLIDCVCGNKGKCGKCKVQIISGRVTAPDDVEKAFLSQLEIENGYRLACRVKVEDDLRIIVPIVNSASDRKSELMHIPYELQLTRHIRKYFVKVSAASLHNQKSDEERILEALPDDGIVIDAELMDVISEIASNIDQYITLTIYNKRVIALDKENTTAFCYGVAFDIGTTTVVGLLWDLNNGQLVSIETRTNPQNVYGADVISRINYSADSNNLKTLKFQITNCCNEIINCFTKKYKINSKYIYEATVVGNSTMSHLFLGINPGKLAKSPFIPVISSPVNRKAPELGLTLNSLAKIHILPNIASHLGSDLVGVLLASRLENVSGLSLIIDVGTNGEMVLSLNGRLIACSTAAGPAFEGATVFQGMRASAGAIEGVKITDSDVILKVIDNKIAVGICGSGLIDAVAQMLEAGIITETGKLISRDHKNAEKLPEAIKARMRYGKNGNEFILAWGESSDDIVITQKDIREVQLAKGAIYAGIAIMLNRFDKKAEELDRIFVAGAFGNYINKGSALRIGLFPEILPDKIFSIGNGAGIGASIALLSINKREEALAWARKVEHLELAALSEFQNEYIKAMSFPKRKEVF